MLMEKKGSLKDGKCQGLVYAINVLPIDARLCLGCGEEDAGATRKVSTRQFPCIVVHK